MTPPLNTTDRVKFLQCNTTKHCVELVTHTECGYSPIANDKVCLCTEDHLPAPGPDGTCNNLPILKHCSTTTECGPDATCQINDDEEIGICMCISALSKANRFGGGCDGSDIEDISDIGKTNNGIIDLAALQSNMMTRNRTSNSTERTMVERQREHVSDNTLHGLQIILPLTFLMMVLVIIAFIFFVRRSRMCRKRKSRKQAIIRNREDVELLDKMNNVNTNPSYYMTLTGKKFPITEIEADKVKILEVVGEGAFGQVYKGSFHPTNKDVQNVAIKVLKEDVSHEARADFEREVEIMSSFDHDNILKLLGVVTKGFGESPYMIFEYMVYGDLADVLRQNDPAMRTKEQSFKLQKKNLIDIAIQIATGMTYLTEQHFVHRDLATRNCLVGDELTVKIADFGMARDIYTCDYYEIGGSRMLPVRWMSPEAIKYGRFTTESDIWAFGVVLWEIFSYGRQPYFGHVNEEVVRFLDDGILLQKPDECPSTVYHIMLGCWKSAPKERLVFSRIHKHLTDFSNDVMKNTCIENESEIQAKNAPEDVNQNREELEEILNCI